MPESSDCGTDEITWDLIGDIVELYVKGWSAGAIAIELETPTRIVRHVLSACLEES